MKSVALMAATACLVMAACGSKTTDKADTVEVEPVEIIEEVELPTADDELWATDSVGFDETARVGKNGSVTCRIGVDFPVSGRRSVQINVIAWIQACLSDSPMGPLKNRGSEAFRIKDGQQLVDAVGAEVIASAKADIESLGDEVPVNQYEYMWNISELYTTKKFVTYGCMTYAYAGGAHGGTAFEGAVFGLANGRLYGWDLFDEGSLKALTAIVKDAVMREYFNASSMDDIVGDLLVKPEDFPLPAAPPYLTEDGVAFVYQQYEIAVYAAGMPSVTIPYSVMKPLMSAEGRALLD